MRDRNDRELPTRRRGSTTAGEGRCGTAARPLVMALAGRLSDEGPQGALAGAWHAVASPPSAAEGSCHEPAASSERCSTAPSSIARDLSSHHPVILFVDGASPRGVGTPMLCAWTITWEGRRVLLAVEPGAKDAPDACWAFLAGLKDRGLADPLLVVTDGESALLRASELCFPTALQQRCLSHQVRALGYRMPQGAASTVLHAAQASYEAPSATLGAAMRRDVVRRYAAAFPSLVSHFDRTFDSCTTHHQLPASLRRAARATLVPEWMLVVERRATSTAVASANDAETLAALAAALELALGEGPRIAIGDAERAHLDALAANRKSGELRVG